MNNLNSVIIEGNIIRDPASKETSKGTSLCCFSVATNRSYRNQDGSFEKEVSYFDIETWGKLADLCIQNCKKGRGVRVVGRIKQNRWTGSDGKSYSKISIIAEHVEFKPVFVKNKETQSHQVVPTSEPVPSF